MSLLALVAVGLVRVLILHDPAATGIPRQPVPGGETVGALLILKAFSSGCTAMTGIEAVSNGVPAFTPPESRNAATTMLWMSGILGTLFIGIVGLFYAYGLVPDATGNPTLLSQLTEQVVGRSWFYYVIQGSTLLVLVLAANTSYADFPRLSVILARHDFAPHLFGFRGVSPWHPRAEPLPTLAFTGRSAYTRGRLYEYDCVDTGRPMRYATISPAGPPPGIAT